MGTEAKGEFDPPITPRGDGERDFNPAVRSASSKGHRSNGDGRGYWMVALEVAAAADAVRAGRGVLWPGADAPARSRLNRAAKRSLDIILGLAAIVVVAPLWIAIAISIKLDSPGPILFRQPRVGQGGRRFQMLKFRTMVDGADGHKDEFRHLNECPDGLFKIAADPRITRFGRFLRTTSLDELPQVLQVVTGKMSLVGPRPLVPEEDALIQGQYRHRLEVRPGITGPWQVAGASKVPIREMVRLDHDYVMSWSLGRDFKLLIGTVPHVLGRRGV